MKHLEIKLLSAIISLIKQLSIVSLVFVALLFTAFQGICSDNPSHTQIPENVVREVQQELKDRFGEQELKQIIEGTQMVASLWRESDGTTEDFKKFCSENYLGEEGRQKNLPVIMENLNVLNGYSSIIRSRLTEHNRFTDRDEIETDSFFQKSIPDFDPWKSKLAFFIQLNFPYVEQAIKNAEGPAWSREKWATVRLGDTYSSRRSTDFEVPYREEAAAWGRFIGRYFFRMGQLMPNGKPTSFPEGFLLNCHHGLRDNIKEEYTREGGYERQHLTGLIIERILNGQVPLEFITDTATYWDPVNQQLFSLKDDNTKEAVGFTYDGLKRYEGLFHAIRNRQAEDKIYGPGSTVISRTLDNAQMTVDQVEGMLRDFLGSPQFKEIGAIIQNKLGRDLEPFDIWYSGFQAQSAYAAAYLDSIVSNRYPTPMDLQNDLPLIFKRLGFSDEDAEWLGTGIEIRPVHTGGYSNRPPLPGYNALFTTAFGSKGIGLDYKGFRIAMHELGHVTDMLYGSREIDYQVLRGVPTAGITEGAAEFIAYRNILALGLDEKPEPENKHMQALATFWYNVDMGGQALTEIEIWKWMYNNPDATPEDLKEAVLEIAQTTWNDYFAPVFGVKDQNILSIYNHMITGSFYLFNYFMGNVVMFQYYNDDFMDEPGTRFAKATAEGRTLPDLWMMRAVGQPVSIQPMLNAAEEAIHYYKGR